MGGAPGKLDLTLHPDLNIIPYMYKFPVMRTPCTHVCDRAGNGPGIAGNVLGIIETGWEWARNSWEWVGNHRECLGMRQG